MTELTFFEIHLHDASFTANAPGSGAELTEAEESGGPRRFLPGRGGEDEDREETAGADGGGSNPLPKLLAFAGIVLLAVLARRVMRGEKEPVPA